MIKDGLHHLNNLCIMHDAALALLLRLYNYIR